VADQKTASLWQTWQLRIAHRRASGKLLNLWLLLTKSERALTIWKDQRALKKQSVWIREHYSSMTWPCSSSSSCDWWSWRTWTGPVLRIIWGSELPLLWWSHSFPCLDSIRCIKRFSWPRFSQPICNLPRCIRVDVRNLAVLLRNRIGYSIWLWRKLVPEVAGEPLRSSLYRLPTTEVCRLWGRIKILWPSQKFYRWLRRRQQNNGVLYFTAACRSIAWAGRDHSLYAWSRCDSVRNLSGERLEAWRIFREKSCGEIMGTNIPLESMY
jgi:hypothetical protein